MPPTVNEEIKQLLLAKNRNAKAGLKAIKGVLAQAQKQVKAEIGLAAIDSWDSFHLPQLLAEIERHIANFGTSMQSAVSGLLDDTWDLGVESVNSTLLNANELNIGNFFIPKSSLEALKNFTFTSLKGVSESARASISGEVSLGILSGKSPRDVSRAIGNVLANGKDLTDRSIWAKIHRRAAVITNTEMGRVLSVATNERIEEAARHVPDLKKRWIHAGHPAKPRPSHVREEFEKPISVDQPFIVDGVPMMFPRDPAAPIEQVINCGCIHVAFKDSWKNAGKKKVSKKIPVVPLKKVA